MAVNWRKILGLGDSGPQGKKTGDRLSQYYLNKGCERRANKYTDAQAKAGDSREPGHTIQDDGTVVTHRTTNSGGSISDTPPLRKKIDHEYEGPGGKPAMRTFIVCRGYRPDKRDFEYADMMRSTAVSGGEGHEDARAKGPCRFLLKEHGKPVTALVPVGNVQREMPFCTYRTSGETIMQRKVRGYGIGG